jgi:hypothetical protein
MKSKKNHIKKFPQKKEEIFFHKRKTPKKNTDKKITEKVICKKNQKEKKFSLDLGSSM